jgi:hypothetical protein
LVLLCVVAKSLAPANSSKWHINNANSFRIHRYSFNLKYTFELDFQRSPIMFTLLCYSSHKIRSLQVLNSHRSAFLCDWYLDRRYTSCVSYMSSNNKTADRGLSGRQLRSEQIRNRMQTTDFWEPP